uniref:Chlororespiratory reduction 7 n=1 Tax=Habenaria pantlingiana TaxID=1498489 RepID=A0A0F7H111_9ASPA
MEVTLRMHSLNSHGFQIMSSSNASKTLNRTCFCRTIVYGSQPLSTLVCSELRQPMMKSKKHHFKVFAVRRRRAHMKSETYVLLEPGKNEEFISEEELRIRLKGWLETWPGEELPPDLAGFKTIDEAVSHLIRSVCELEIDGEVGSIQWYQVQLE